MDPPRKPAPPRYIVDETGKRVSVVLPVEEYEELLEDIADLAAVAERRQEGTTTHALVVERLKADGLL
ncbi:MAG: hypothetical protein HY423_16315 [Candidatus Lambdaproteobacteria bacterium]|nr:hypothetical protein [Candidatus Lambdaproteobacteria bacterium]